MKHNEIVQENVPSELFSMTELLLKKANTCTTETRWKRQLVTEVYKALHGLTPSYISNMSTMINEDPNSLHNLNYCPKLMDILPGYLKCSQTIKCNKTSPM